MKINVAVFFGGESVEHEVSVISAHQAIEAFDKNMYEIVPLYIAKNRKIYFGDALLDIENYKNLDMLISRCEQVTLVNTDGKVCVIPVKSKLLQKKVLAYIDVAFPIMHGTNGEDGTIQGFIEMLKIPYVGCDLYGAAVGQDKVLMKHILHDNGLPMTEWFYCFSDEFEDKKEEILKKVHQIGYPVILKPSRTGSSVGIEIAHNDEEFENCFGQTRLYDEKVIVEKVVKPMREINCSVLGNKHHAKASVLEEVTKKSDSDNMLTFSDKYGQGGSKGFKQSGSKSQGMASTSRIVPAPLDEETTRLIQKYALETFKVLQCEGVCRIDFMIDEETKFIYVNEINTIPGSLAFYLWTASGTSFASLLQNLVELALERERRRAALQTSFTTNILSSFSQGVKGSKH